MQSLALPRPTSLRSTSFGHSSEPEDGLAKLRTKFSPGRPEQQGYPSPPMSEPHSPTRRTAQTSEPARHAYPPLLGTTRGVEAHLPLPPSSSLFIPGSVHASHSAPQQQPSPYLGEHARPQSAHYGTDRGTEQQPYRSVPLPQSYTYGYPPTSMAPYAGSQHGGPMGQQAPMLAPSASRTAKPARRTKAHVASACVNCKKAHLSCDVQRPCGRCVASGKQDTCKDVQHKKRGRPRLRDDREFSRPEDSIHQASQILGTLPTSVAQNYVHEAPYPGSRLHRPSEPGRHPLAFDESHASNMIPPRASTLNGVQTSHRGAVTASPYASEPKTDYQTLPWAFLNLDLVIQKSNRAFQDLVFFLGDIKGKHLGELLEARQGDSLLRLRNDLRDEKNERDPTYMAPITPMGQDPLRPVMDTLADRDVDPVSHGFTDRPMYLSFRLPNGQYQSLQVQVRLAKTSLYFVTLVVRTPRRLSRPPLLTQQLAPPTPDRHPQAMSAPTIASSKEVASHHSRPLSSTSSAPSSPYFNFSSVRTSLPGYSPSSYSNSPSYGVSPKGGPESGYFPTIQPPTQPGTGYPSPYAPAPPRIPSQVSETISEHNRPARLEGLHLPPIRSGPAPLGSPLLIEGQSRTERERELVRRRANSPNDDQRTPETPDTSNKRRRLGIHEMLE